MWQQGGHVLDSAESAHKNMPFIMLLKSLLKACTWSIMVCCNMLVLVAKHIATGTVPTYTTSTFSSTVSLCHASQSCYMAFPVVDATAVYLCTGNPQPADIEAAMHWLFNDDLVTAYKSESGPSFAAGCLPCAILPMCMCWGASCCIHVCDTDMGNVSQHPFAVGLIGCLKSATLLRFPACWQPVYYSGVRWHLSTCRVVTASGGEGSGTSRRCARDPSVSIMWLCTAASRVLLLHNMARSQHASSQHCAETSWAHA
jgi:hypothetical protein